MVAFASCNNAVVVAFFSQNIKLKNVEKELTFRNITIFRGKDETHAICVDELKDLPSKG